jgi:hypothetical protein
MAIHAIQKSVNHSRGKNIDKERKFCPENRIESDLEKGNTLFI